jgi:hypothetical protein
VAPDLDSLLAVHKLPIQHRIYLGLQAIFCTELASAGLPLSDILRLEMK